MCTSCGAIHYENPKIIVGCLVSWGDRLLMSRRSQEPERGRWEIPAGFLECDETLEEGAARETLEETGVIVKPADLELCMVINMTAIQQVTIAFRVALADKPNVRLGAESLEVAFASEDWMSSNEIAWHGTWAGGLKRFFQEIRSCEYTIQLMTLGANQGVGFKSRTYGLAS